MKRRVAAIAILSVLLLCGVVAARTTTVVVGQGVPVVGGEPAAGTIILGSNSTVTGDTAGVAINTQWYNYSAVAASWTESDSTATVSSVYVYLTANNTGNCKAFIADSSGTIITNGVSNALAFTEDDVPLFRQFTYTSKPTLSKGTSYRPGFVCSSDYVVILPTATGGQGPMRHDGSYTSPASVVPGSDSNYGQGSIAIYAVH